MQVISAPDGRPIRVSPVRPGREHGTTRARAHGLIAALDRLATIPGQATLAHRFDKQNRTGPRDHMAAVVPDT